jgi:alpha-beta hydrolase superfamily lysophospholipase
MLNPEFQSLSAAPGYLPLHATRGDGFSTSGTWFGPADRPLAGWWTAPDSPSCDGVVIAQPLGYEYWSCHRSLRTLAESLARAGWHVLRFDWDGTGDSAGAADDPDRMAAWRASLANAVTAMRNAGMRRVVLIGVRLGATFALLDAAALDVDEIIACAPLASGKRFVKELKLLGLEDPENPGCLTYSGLHVGPTTIADLTGIDLRKRAPPAVGRTLLVTRSSDPNPLSMLLRKDSRMLETHTCEDLHSMLDAPAGEDALPSNFLEPILEWLGRPQARGKNATPTLRAKTRIPWRAGSIRATFTQLDGLAAICTQPADCNPDSAVIFLNSGADPHVGPGRAWVEYSRALALRGYACFRTDFTAFGESPDEGLGPGRPYDEHCIDDTIKLVAALRRRYQRVVLAGLCVGAWLAMKVAQTTPVDGVFALSPQLWWRPGLPIIIRIPDTIAWRKPIRQRQRRLARLGWWSFLDAIGIRPMASRWLIALRRRRVPLMISFAEGDDGLAYLRDRCARRLARESRHGYLTLEEVHGIDHPMFRTWRRQAVIAQMLRFLDSLPPTRAASGS